MGGGAVETRDSNDNMLEGGVKYWHSEEVAAVATTGQCWWRAGVQLFTPGPKAAKVNRLFFDKKAVLYEKNAPRALLRSNYCSL